MSVKDHLKKLKNTKTFNLLMGLCALAVAPSCMMAPQNDYQGYYPQGQGQGQVQGRPIHLVNEVKTTYAADGTRLYTSAKVGGDYYRGTNGQWLRNAQRVEDRTGSSRASRLHAPDNLVEVRGEDGKIYVVDKDQAKTNVANLKNKAGR